ncbi:MAG: hypothetical protein ACI4WS_14530 [Oscillospiraceae bacterium]
MKQEEKNIMDLPDEELKKVSGGANTASNPNQLTYAYEPGDRVKCSYYDYSTRSRVEFEGIIVSKSYKKSQDMFDLTFYSTYSVMPDGGTKEVEVSENHLTKIG